LLRRRLTSWAAGRLLSRFVPGFTIGFAYGLILGADEIQTGVVLPKVCLPAAWRLLARRMATHG
jgi:hypothetical protein